jgi:hypothetical protein
LVDGTYRHCSHSRVCVGVLEGMEMKTQPEALRFAEELEIKAKALGFSLSPHATELRRLHEVNQELLAALKNARELVEEWGAYASAHEQDRYGLKSDLLILDSVIARAGEQQ